MKKKLLLVAILFLSMTGTVFSAETQNTLKPPIQSSLHQKACQNVFSFINIDLSLMSPRGTAADVSIVDSANTNSNSGNAKNEAITPVSNKQEVKQPISAQKSKTSLFRIDLLHIFKIQIL